MPNYNFTLQSLLRSQAPLGTLSLGEQHSVWAGNEHFTLGNIPAGKGQMGLNMVT
jgi:hypothetical protein